MAYQIPQTVLAQLLTMKNTAPERLSHDEAELSTRICRCSLCAYLWIRRLAQIPDRCPKCHKRGWDRPFLNALLAAKPTTIDEQPKSSTPAIDGGAK
jgi:hypothetical protein